jgi:hypothetical protein
MLNADLEDHNYFLLIDERDNIDNPTLIWARCNCVSFGEIKRICPGPVLTLATNGIIASTEEGGGEAASGKTEGEGGA